MWISAEFDEIEISVDEYTVDMLHIKHNPNKVNGGMILYDIM